MLSFDNRMLIGTPLLYYPQYQQLNLPINQFQFFNRFTAMNEDLMVPNSPNSVKSDSDNSVSSVDISQSVLNYANVYNKNKTRSKVQCCWKNCGIFLESLDQLALHVSKAHSASGVGGLFYCGWEGCTRNNRGFNARYKMLVHVRTHTNEKPHQCNQCEKSFSRAENLKIHIRSHSGEKPYVCSVPGCNKAYSNSSDRFKHTRTHQVEKPYQCKVPGCPKKYTDPSSLRKHVKTYKHFVNENNTSKPFDDELQNNNFNNSDSNFHKHNKSSTIGNTCYKESNPVQRCNCSHTCCMSENITKATELINLKGFINFQKVTSNPWNKILDPFIASEPKSIFSSYETRQDCMDIDLPLDLSISQKHVS